MRRWVKRIAWVFAALAVMAAAGALVLSSGWFAEKVRNEIIARTEAATGGRVRLDSFHFDWKLLRASVRGFTLHGAEPATSAPFVRVESAALDLRIVSLLSRDVVLERLSLVRPEVHIYVDDAGKTNIPSPARPDPKANPVANLLKLKIRKLEVSGGTFEYDHRAIPFHLLAEHLEAKLDYRARGPAYAVAIGTKHLRLNEYGGVGFDAAVRLESNRVLIDRLEARRRQLKILLDGELADFKAPRLTVNLKAHAPLSELEVREISEGTAGFEGRLEWSDKGYSVRGPLRVDGFAWTSPMFKLTGASLRASASLLDGDIELNRVKVSALGGAWQGDARLRNWSKLELTGQLSELALSSLLAAIPETDFPWDGVLSGQANLTATVSARGISSAQAGAALDVAPVEGRLPVQGRVEAAWDEDAGLVTLNDSTLSLPSTNLRVAGVLGKSLNASIHTTDVAEVEAAIGLFTENKRSLAPLTLAQGSARLSARIDGPLSAPRFSGQANLSRFKLGDVAFDTGAANFELSESKLEVHSFEARQGQARSSGRGEIGLKEWALDPSSTLQASANLRLVDAADVARLLKLDIAPRGRLDVNATMQGTLEAPQGSAGVHWSDAVLGGERFNRISATLQTRNGESLAFNGSLDLDGDRVTVDGIFDHASHNWREGVLNLEIGTKRIRASQFEMVRDVRPDLVGVISAELKARVAIRKSEPSLEALNGFTEVEMSAGTRRIGALRFDAATQGQTLNVRTQGSLSGHPLGGEARVRLVSGYPVEGRVALPRISFRALQLAFAEDPSELWPVQGFLGGDLSFKGSVLKPASMTARAAITRFQIGPRAGRIVEADIETSNLTLRNSGPIAIDIEGNNAFIRSVRFLAKDTSLTVAGVYSFSSRSPLDLSLNGVVGLEVLSTFQPDLIANGTARLSANMRGSLANPTINGQARISDASFFIRDIANGIENANGTVFFDRDRAQIENLQGQTGGGTFKLTGFVGFGSRELTYRLQGEGESIRVRYPEGVSTTADASLSLTGTSSRSLLTGTLTVRRSGFNIKQDLGSIIAGSAAPIPVPSTDNEFLRNLQFDVRVRTAANATFQTSYTRDLETRADLRIRGSIAKPVVLGSVEVNQGEVQFFGNEYNISRGEILFFNTAAIQPSINLDLETRIRGVTVFINVSGPLNRLDVNYRSEPPLQSQEILALLTVGRAPTATTSAIPASISSRNTVLGESNANTLLGGALSASVSSRVQKFFGASRIKIDPNVTGVENLPQARLTLEQSLTRNVIFTFSINLSRSSQQVVRMEWDLSNEWSLIAVRDENGAFGVDFLFRRRFK